MLGALNIKKSLTDDEIDFVYSLLEGEKYCRHFNQFGVPKNFCYKTKLIALLVQALKALKQQNVGQEEIQVIRSLISKEPDRIALAKDVDMMPNWMKRIVKPML